MKEINKSPPLTEKQKAFADEYLRTQDAVMAMSKAGYSKKSALGMLENPRIKQYIEQHRADNPLLQSADKQEIMHFLSEVMRGNITEPVIIRVDGEQTLEMIPLTVKDRIKAAEMLGKCIGISDDSTTTAEPVIIYGGDML